MKSLNYTSPHYHFYSDIGCWLMAYVVMRYFMPLKHGIRYKCFCADTDVAQLYKHLRKRNALRWQSLQWKESSLGFIVAVHRW